MQIDNDFTVRMPVDEVWKLFLDVERLAPCMPGAQLTEIDGDEYKGIVKVKVGAVNAQYKGTVIFEEIIEKEHRLVLRAKGRETKGQGTANAAVTVCMTERGSETDVEVRSDLQIRGKVAQFGRGILVDVAEKLVDEFIEAAEAELAAHSTELKAQATEAVPPAGTLADSVTTGPRIIDSPEAEPIDLLELGGASVGKRLLPVVGFLSFLLLFIVLWRRKCCGGGSAPDRACCRRASRR